MKLQYSIKQRKRASTFLALAESEAEAAETLLGSELAREAVVHLYYACFYISQALLCDRLRLRASHKGVEGELHKAFGKSPSPLPRRYVDLHTRLHPLRTATHYRTPHTPSPSALGKELRLVKLYLKKALSMLDPVEYADVLRDLRREHGSAIRDFSVDVYCPKSYSHHTRVTVWYPPGYLDVFTIATLTKRVQELLRRLRVPKSKLYVAGLNSKLDQYGDTHLLMLDIDSIDAEVEHSLHDIGGTLLKTGRGFHFLGRDLICGRKEWEKRMGQMLRHPVLKSRVDRDHIEISLSRGYSTLRMTPSPVKPSRPIFFKEF